MPASNVAVIGAGTTLRYETTPDTYIDLNHALTIGTLGQKGTFVDNTPIKSLDKTFIRGDKEAEEKEFTFNDVPGDTDQEAFLALAATGQTLNMQVEFPSGRIGTFSAVLNGWQTAEPARDGAQTVVVSAQVSGGVIWSIAP